MSDNIPLEIQMEIIQRIPEIKSVILCRSVSKAWKSVIDSKDFVTAHTLRHTHHANRHLLIRKQDFCQGCKYTSICLCDSPIKYVSIVDDDATFPHKKLSLNVPDLVRSKDSILLGSSHGLFCLYGRATKTAVIWNPLIRKTVDVAIPNVLCELQYQTVVGFGICPNNILDLKLVKITFVRDTGSILLIDENTSAQVEVFTLTSSGVGTWRSPLSSNVPHKWIRFGRYQAVIDGFIYWGAIDRIGDGSPNLIMSFDLTSEEFTRVNLPDCLAHNPDAFLSVSNLRESLVVLDFDIHTATEVCDVWMMIGHGCTRSFSMLYSIKAPFFNTLGFRKNGTPIIEVQTNLDDYDYAPIALAIYEPGSESITKIGIDGLPDTFFVHSYMETLLLLDY